MLTALVVVAVACIAGLLFVVLGYPMLVRLRARGREAPSALALRARAMDHRADQAWPRVSVIVATRDAPDVVLDRVRDLRATIYPAARLDVVVAVDAGSEHAVDAYAATLGDLAVVVPGDAPGGKSMALNAGVRRAEGEVLVFADSRQRFSPNAIPDLVTALEPDGVGAVSGMVVSALDDAVMDRYWNYELALRRRQSAIHSIICVSGAIYALRRRLWEPMPPSLICDDLFVTLGLVVRGWRVGFCDTARAVDPREFTRQQHFDRKVRTLTGLLQLCAWKPEVLSPRRNAIWIDLVLHKLTRIIMPYLAIGFALSIAGIALLVGGRVALGLAAIGVVLAAIIAVVRPGLLRTALWAAKLCTIPMIATNNALRGRWQVWTTHAGRNAPPNDVPHTPLADGRTRAAS